MQGMKQADQPEPSSGGEPAKRGQVRREPPPFRIIEVLRLTPLSPRMIRATFTGRELEGFAVKLPGASVRLLLPSPGASDLVIPVWNGNEFLLTDGSRPIIRTFTPRRVDTEARKLDLDIVIHGGGAASAWAQAAQPGNPAAISGPGRGYEIEGDGFLLVGDESAIPAISQLLEHLPAAASVQIHIEVAHPDARLDLPDHPGATVEWQDLPPGAPPGDTLVAAVAAAALGPDNIRVWAAGEAASMQRIRRHLFEKRGLPRSRATVRGYWKMGRGGDSQ